MSSSTEDRRGFDTAVDEVPVVQRRGAVGHELDRDGEVRRDGPRHELVGLFVRVVPDDYYG